MDKFLPQWADACKGHRESDAGKDAWAALWTDAGGTRRVSRQQGIEAIKASANDIPPLKAAKLVATYYCAPTTTALPRSSLPS